MVAIVAVIVAFHLITAAVAVMTFTMVIAPIACGANIASPTAVFAMVTFAAILAAFTVIANGRGLIST